MSTSNRKRSAQPGRASGKEPRPSAEALAELMVFSGADTRAELDRRMKAQVEIEVAAILTITDEFDAFDLIDLMRQRELPISPIMGLAGGFDGSGAVIELIALVLLTRNGRNPAGVPREDTRPHEAIPELHDRAKRLIRLSVYRAKFAERVGGDDPIARLAAEYQAYFVGVRALQYESVQADHDRALFDRPEIERLLRTHLGFSYNDFTVVRDAIATRYSSTITSLRDKVGDIIETAQSDGRDPRPHELATFQQSMIDWMFLPAERAAFRAADIAELAGVDDSLVESVLAAFSIEFDCSRNPTDTVAAFLRGVNPLARTGLVRSGNQFLMTSSPIGSDSFRSTVEAALKPHPKSWHRYDRSRTEASETLAIRAVERALQTPATHTNLKYFAAKADRTLESLGRGCENPREVAELVEGDALIIVEDVAICVEVKGRTVADAARRGDLARLKTEIENILGAGAGQARRLATLIHANGGVWVQDGTWVDLSHVKETRSIVVGLDYFGPLTVAVGDLDQTGLLGTGSIPWMTSLHDLDVISRVVDRPSEFLLYLRRRTDSGVAKFYRGTDELDLFMLYMDGSLYVENDPDEVHLRHPRTPPPKKADHTRHGRSARPTYVGTFTDPLDAWMYHVEGGSPFDATKPVFNAHPSALRLVDFLADARKPGWFRFGADLLALSGRAQKSLHATIRKLATTTRADRRSHSVVQGYAGLWGYPTLFVATLPREGSSDAEAERLHTYMKAKKHQVQSDRSLGLLVDERRNIVHVVYMNDQPTADPDLDHLGVTIGLQPAEKPPTLNTSQVSRPRRKRKGRGGKRR